MVDAVDIFVVKTVVAEHARDCRAVLRGDRIRNLHTRSAADTVALLATGVEVDSKRYAADIAGRGSDAFSDHVDLISDTGIPAKMIV